MSATSYLAMFHFSAIQYLPSSPKQLAWPHLGLQRSTLRNFQQLVHYITNII